ncbi:MAG: PQQ-dependent sugar dehydrogenase [Blastocatellia bacterium]
MVATKLSWFVFFLALCCPALATAQTFADPGFTAESYATVTRYQTTSFSFAPDGRVFTTEKRGLVRVIKNGVMLTRPFLDISAHVNQTGDRGLLGMTLDPDFRVNGYLYLVYVYEQEGVTGDTGPKTARLSRFQVDPGNPDLGLPGSELVLAGRSSVAPCGLQPAGADCIGADSTSHSIGTVRFGPDGKLYFGMGDGASFDFSDILALRAQDLDSYNGKILRLNRDGTAPPDNPFYNGDPRAIRSKVYAYGLRNPFRFTIHPATGEVVIGDVGLSHYEEINRGRGANFGWPCFEGNDPAKGFQDAFPAQCAGVLPDKVTRPLYTYRHVAGAAVVGGPFYTAAAYPARYHGNYFFGDYTQNDLWRIVFDGNGAVAGVEKFATGAAAPVDLEPGPDGLLYYLSLTQGEIRRIRYSENQLVARAAAALLSPAAPYTVVFSSAGSVDPAGGALGYLWEFGDGQTSTAASPVHAYTATGVRTYKVTLTVTGAGGARATASVDIAVGSRPPVAVINTPAPGVTAISGQTLTFSGAASDPDETLGEGAMAWTVLLHHGEHVHPDVTATGASGSFTVQDHSLPGEEFYYEIILTVTDSAGQRATAAVRVDTAPAGLPAPWALLNIGNAGMAGSAVYDHGVFSLRGAGLDIGGVMDSFVFLQQAASGDLEITARVASVEAATPGTIAGIMMRAGPAPDAAHVMLCLRPAEGVFLSWRAATGQQAVLVYGGYVMAPQWLRLARAGGVITGSISADGITWTRLGTAPVSLPAQALAGLVLSSGGASESSEATFGPVSVRTTVNQPPAVSLGSPGEGAVFTAPARIALQATATDSDGAITSVEFYAGNQRLSVVNAAPYAYTWADAPAGSYTITARARDNAGGVTESRPVSVTVRPAANNPPVVSLTAPGPGLTLPAPATVALAATASDSDGQVVSVQFFVNQQLSQTITAAPYTGALAGLAAGTYTIFARAVDNNGGVADSAAITLTVTNVVQGSGAGLRGEYFRDDKINHRKLAFSRTDAAINFDWGRESPRADIKKDNFAVRWTGFLQPRYTEATTLWVTSGDQVILWLDDQQVLSHTGKVETSSVRLPLVAGRKYKIRVEFYEKDKEAFVRLEWAGVRQAREVIPPAQLYQP